MQKELINLLYITLAVLILLLSTLNLSTKPKQETKVLGTTTDNSYWEEMVVKHQHIEMLGLNLEEWIRLSRLIRIFLWGFNFFSAFCRFLTFCRNFTLNRCWCYLYNFFFLWWLNFNNN